MYSLGFIGKLLVHHPNGHPALSGGVRVPRPGITIWVRFAWEGGTMGRSVQRRAAAAPPNDGASAVARPPGAVPSNSELIAMVEAERRLGAAGALRTSDEILESGVLTSFGVLENVEVEASEFDRTVDDDAILVKQGLAKMTPEEVSALKNQAYEHPEAVKGTPVAIQSGHYGSKLHREYGALVEKLTGGVISAEEAMAMNPSGGLPGPGNKEVPFAKDIAPVARHAMRHDATGFLLTRFGVGPGYGSKTTPLGLEKDNPLAGQVLGVLREMFTPSELPDGEEVAKPGRFA